MASDLLLALGYRPEGATEDDARAAAGRLAGGPCGKALTAARHSAALAEGHASLAREFRVPAHRAVLRDEAMAAAQQAADAADFLRAQGDARWGIASACATRALMAAEAI
ncbi:MAG: hypothetical protein KGK07_14455 [Chloroflexota bacterium]|nr:hypothetical protein [Chloroflexota bacterium]